MKEELKLIINSCFTKEYTYLSVPNRNTSNKTDYSQDATESSRLIFVTRNDAKETAQNTTNVKGLIA